MTRPRKHLRYIVVDVGVTVKTLFREVVELLDVSIGGASIRSSRSFLMGCEYVFKFNLKERVVSMKGVIVWEKLSGTKKISEGEAMPVYTAGVQFTNADADGAEEIRKFLAEKLKERRLTGVRIKFHTPERTTILSHTEDCVVQDLSIGGMQISMGQKPSLESAFSFELSLTENENLIYGKGRVAYCFEPTEEMLQGCCVGVEFLDMSDEDKIRLNSFLEILPMVE